MFDVVTFLFNFGISAEFAIYRTIPIQWVLTPLLNLMQYFYLDLLHSTVKSRAFKYTDKADVGLHLLLTLTPIILI